jgi:hypothetical protein
MGGWNRRTSSERSADDVSRRGRSYRCNGSPDAVDDPRHRVEPMPFMPSLSSPGTVSEAVNLLLAEGYTDDLGARGSESQKGDDHSHDSADLLIERQFRFEGESNPDDQAIVLGVLCESCDTRGIIVSAYGPDADPALLARTRRPD